LLVLNYLVILFFYPAGGAHGTTPSGPPAGNTTTGATGGLGAMGSADFARNASFFVADSALNPMNL
jgi:hypothetical protein